MIETTYGEIRDQSFFQAIAKIAHSTDIRVPKTRLNIAKIFKMLRGAWEKTTEEFDLVLAQYAEKDADGGFMHPEGNPGGIVVIKGEEKAFAEAEKTFKASVYTFIRPKIIFNDLELIALTSAEIAALDSFLEYDELDDDVRA